ncbi:MAG: 8-amino-7-oxononanoate synthase [Planctomycetota bacterium]
MINYITQELDKLNEEGLLRKPMVISAIKGSQVKIENRWYISFCSNDYLGLTQSPEVKNAMVQATKKFGAGSGAARLLAGTTLLHHSLEQELAGFKRTDDALLFTSGYAANLGVITTLIKKDGAIFCDELNHASLVDASRLTKARLFIYRHRDMAHLEQLLLKTNRLPRTAHRYIITDTIFSMDGDGAPLKEIVRLAKKYNAYTIVDEAHGTGVFGRHGRGLTEELGLEKKIGIIIGTSSKALGSVGGFVTGSQILIDYLRNKSRPFILTTALPPGVCATTITSLKILQKPQGKTLRVKLWENTKYIKSRLQQMGFDLRNSISPIIPILIGDTKKTVDISQTLWKKGLFVPAIRPPTVPQDQSRLRIVINAMHTRKEMDLLLSSIKCSLSPQRINKI